MQKYPKYPEHGWLRGATDLESFCEKFVDKEKHRKWIEELEDEIYDISYLEDEKKK